MKELALDKNSVTEHRQGAVLYCTVLPHAVPIQPCCSVPHCTVSCCTARAYAVLRVTVPCSTMSYYTCLCCVVLPLAMLCVTVPFRCSAQVPQRSRARVDSLQATNLQRPSLGATKLQESRCVVFCWHSLHVPLPSRFFSGTVQYRGRHSAIQQAQHSCRPVKCHTTSTA